MLKLKKLLLLHMLATLLLLLTIEKRLLRHMHAVLSLVNAEVADIDDDAELMLSKNTSAATAADDSYKGACEKRCTVADAVP